MLRCRSMFSSTTMGVVHQHAGGEGDAGQADDVQRASKRCMKTKVPMMLMGMGGRPPRKVEPGCARKRRPATGQQRSEQDVFTHQIDGPRM